MAYELVSANWNRYNFKVDPDLKGQAGYLNGTFYCKVPGTIDARYLTEEFIHAAQDLVYPNGINGLSRPNVEFEVKFLVEINNLYEGWCCDKSLLLPGYHEKLKNQLNKWVTTGHVDSNEYFTYLEDWCNLEGSEYYREENLINKSLAPMLLYKFITEKASCLK